MVASGYGWILIAAVAAAAVGTLAARSAAAPLGLLDQPSPRKLHPKPVPATGGFGILVGLVVGAWLASRVFGVVVFPDSLPRAPLALAALSLFLLGTADDRWRIGPRVKLVAQILICAGASAGGLAATHLPTAWGDVPLGGLGVPLTTLWLVGMVNAINLIDGLDGLAAGLAGLAFAALAAVAVGNGPALLGPICALVVGVVLGFLPFNLSSRRIFLGDGGSLLVGFLLGAVPLVATRLGGDGSAWIVCLGFTAIPILDTATTIVRRKRCGAPVLQADGWHIHHRLLWLGLGPRGALLVLLGLSAGIGLLAVAGVTGWGVVPISAAAALVVAVVAASRMRLRIVDTAADVAAFVFLARRPRNAARRVARDLRPIRESSVS